MYSFLEIIHLTLLTIAKAVFDGWFLLVLAFVFFIISKTETVNIYGYKLPYQNLGKLIESVLQGIIIGIFGSALMALIGLPVRLTMPILFLLPIAIIIAFVNPRFLCFSYSAAILSGISLIFQGQKVFGIKFPYMDVDISGLMVLVGILHLMEAILVFFVGSKHFIPIVTKKNDKIIMGYLLQRFWPIPFSMLALAIGSVNGDFLKMPDWWPIIKPPILSQNIYYYALLPIIGALGYKTITFTSNPYIKARKSSIRLIIYSIILLALAILSTYNLIFKIIGVIYMALAHELIIQYDQYVEIKGKPLFGIPNKGVRILCVYPQGDADKMGIESGDIVHKVNGVQVDNSLDYKMILQNLSGSYITLEVEKQNGVHKIYKQDNVNNDLKLGIQMLPERPAVIFKQEGLNKFSLIHMIIKKLNKKI
ncbi:MAG: PDZ domain-containing protein [Eubacteriales bacterium]